MQDYNEFIRKLRAAASHVGQRITAQEAERRMTAEQIRHRRGQNFMTQERLEYRALAGNGNGPIVVEISHGVFIDSRLIGITVYHSLPEFAARDHDESGCCFSVSEAAARLRELNGGD